MQIVTANDLLEGDVVFLTPDGAWRRAPEAAAIAETPEGAARLLAIATGHEGKVVGPYLAEVTLDAAGRPTPTHYRERIRLKGPTNRLDLGRQAERQSAP